MKVVNSHFYNERKENGGGKWVKNRTFKHIISCLYYICLLTARSKSLKNSIQNRNDELLRNDTS